MKCVQMTLPVLLILGAASFAGVASGETIPFYGEGLGVYTPENGEYLAEGVGTLFGRYTNTGEVTVTPTGDPFVLEFESVTPNVGVDADGNSLVTTFENGVVTLFPDVDGKFTAVWIADAVVVGGSGIYEDAEPAKKPLTIMAVNQPFSLSDPEWKFTWFLTGEVRVGPKTNRHTVKPLKVGGGGLVEGAPIVPEVPVPWEVSGNATLLGRYTSPAIDAPDANVVQQDVDPLYELLPIPFSGTATFIAADGSELALAFEGFLQALPDGNLRWIADFNPVVGANTKRFAKVSSGSVVMLATSPPPDGGEIPFTWSGDGHLIFRKGK